MNNTEQHTEPLAAVLAEMRREAGEQTNPSQLYRYADRIEAAVRSDIAAIRTALFRATEMLDQVYKHSGLTPSMRESISEAVRDADAVLKGTPPPPKRFDEAAFDEAVSKPNGWSGVADPVAEIRRMRDGDTPGNAAALREALEGIEDDCRVLDRKDMWEEEGECYYDALRDIREKVSAALSAPARNCDRFQTEEEAYAAFMGLFDHFKGERHYQYCRWLFAPAEGGDHA